MLSIYIFLLVIHGNCEQAGDLSNYQSVQNCYKLIIVLQILERIEIQIPLDSFIASTHFSKQIGQYDKRFYLFYTSQMLIAR